VCHLLLLLQLQAAQLHPVVYALRLQQASHMQLQQSAQQRQDEEQMVTAVSAQGSRGKADS
jgi:hypothetical protein